MRVIVVGGTGVVGGGLVMQLVERGHNVVVVSRSERSVPTGVPVATWDPVSGAGLRQACAGADAVVHLARSHLPLRLEPQARQALFAARLGMVRRIVEGIASLDPRPSVFLCGSSHDFYGRRPNDVPLSEGEPPGDDLLADLYAQIEAQAQPLRAFGIRVVLGRMGVVLGHGTSDPRWIQHVIADSHGALSWIHVADCARILAVALERAVHGPVNVTAEKPTTGRAIAVHLRLRDRCDLGQATALRTALRRTPEGASLGLWRAAHEAPVNDRVTYQPHWAYPGVMKQLGFHWRIPSIEEALRD